MGILWLASYPKSGNTWLRAFLANYMTNPREPLSINELDRFCTSDGLAWPYEKLSGRRASELTGEDISRLRPRVHAMLAAGRPETVIVKTHNAIELTHGVPTISPDVTEGAVYVIRNPLDVVSSYAWHYSLSLEDAAKAMASPATTIHGSEQMIVQLLGSWSRHVRGWVDAPGLTRHVVRYEDMASRPLKAFGGVVEFLRLPKHMERLKRAVRFSDFKELSRQEREAGFKERSRTAESFFRQGRAGAWRDSLPEALVASIVAEHGEMMSRFGYLDAKGNPV